MGKLPLFVSIQNVQPANVEILCQDANVLMKLHAKIEKAKQEQVRACYPLIYRLNWKDEKYPGLVSAIHPKAAISYAHNENATLKVGDVVDLKSIFIENDVQARVMEVSPWITGEMDYVYLEAIDEATFVQEPPQRLNFDDFHEGLAYTLIGLLDNEPCVEGYGNIYSRKKTKEGHYRGTSPAMIGESGALVVSKNGAIIGINVGGYNFDDPKNANIGSHRLIVPIFDFEEKLKRLDEQILAKNALYFHWTLGQRTVHRIIWKHLLYEEDQRRPLSRNKCWGICRARCDKKEFDYRKQFFKANANIGSHRVIVPIFDFEENFKRLDAKILTESNVPQVLLTRRRPKKAIIEEQVLHMLGNLSDSL
ncbi:unnamed protein product, partial [Mesorhabditis belari]|uniref:Serine protease n=1 Tax=Mesorhabditis belari TaxID=2138241 RepID=A0AAF3FPU3_9BILA